MSFVPVRQNGRVYECRFCGFSEHGTPIRVVDGQCGPRSADSCRERMHRIIADASAADGFDFEVGELVCPAHRHESHDRHVGVVEARELYQHAGGSGFYYYVRWVKPDGNYDANTVRLHESYLELA